jgi:hypothetical protein
MVDLALLQSISYMAGALGVCVAAIFYVLNLRISQRNMKLTLETRQAQLLMPIYQNFCDTDFMRKWVMTTNLMDFKNYDDFVEKYDYVKKRENIEIRSQLASLFAYFEGIGVLVEEKLIDPELVAKLMSGNLIRFWDKFGPIVIELRGRNRTPGEWNKTEYLYNEIKKLRKIEWPSPPQRMA